MDLEREIVELGSDLYARMHGETPGLFNRDYWQGRILDWVMKDPSFKVDMFRFVDVLPVLETSDQVAEHIREYLLKEDRQLPIFISAALKAAAGGLTSGIAAKAIRKNVTDMAERFIVGSDAGGAKNNLLELHRSGIAFTVDLLGEAVVSEKEALAYQQQCLNLITKLAKEVQRWPDDEVIDFNHLGRIPRANVSMKITALDPQLKAIDPAGGVDRLKKMAMPLFLQAKENNVFLNIDIETWEMHGITYDFFEEMLSQPELRMWPHMGIVVQAYLKSAKQDLDRLLSLAKKRGAPITVRLVKGAYWDYEVVRAKQFGFECPVFTDKAETDANYEALSKVLLQNVDDLQPAFGSHNLRSISHALVAAASKKIPAKALEVQMLYGMAEPERKVLRQLGHRVRVYAPVGQLLPGMAYLVRRLLENTSNAGFLRMTHHQHVDTKSLFASPTSQHKANGKQQVEGTHAGFANCPFLDFTREDVRRDFDVAVRQVEASLPIRVPVVISGKKVAAKRVATTVCPSLVDKAAAEVSFASIKDCDVAVQIARQSFTSWRATSLEKRATLLGNLADELQKNRVRLAALQTWEVAKPWAEADADVAEAIDFCRYYAAQARMELAPRQQGNVWGESNQLYFDGRGPTLVIAPWNFPLAILCGMTTAALVAGNPVLMKPAEQSSAIAYVLFEHMMVAGFPPDVVQFLPGDGEEIGTYLVEHPQVAQIAFTGSKRVGLQIVERAAITKPAQPQVKRVVCEMGGKNAVIVDDDADLDEAVLGVMHSAFGYAGQKCSACSRVIVVGRAYEHFVQRLTEACKSLTVCGAHLPGCSLGPVIDGDAHKRLLQEIANGKQNASLLYLGEVPSNGYFVPPAIFAVTDAKHRLMQEEFFGPVVAVMQVKDFQSALAIATSTEFALTGAVFSRNPSHLDQAQKEFRVGNLYLNRGCTGAMVDRQPFGGFHMSGIGTKAGGPGYLHHFVDMRCVTENTMRRGFTPELAT